MGPPTSCRCAARDTRDLPKSRRELRLAPSQAQRDYFGAHTFERLEKRGKWEHANWTGTTGRVTAATYDA